MQQPQPDRASPTPPTAHAAAAGAKPSHSPEHQSGEPEEPSSSRKRDRQRSDKARNHELVANRINVVLALNLPEKAQQVCFSPEEQQLIKQLQLLLGEGPEAFIALATYLQDQIKSQRSLKMLSRTSSVYSSRRGSGIDLKQALQELDKYYWKTHQDFLSNYNARTSNEDMDAASAPLGDQQPAERSRGRARRPSFRRALSAKRTSESQPDDAPPLPDAASVIPSSPPPRSSQRSKSWAPARRSAAKAPREPSPAPSIHGPSEYIYDSDVRAKLKAYLTTPDKFQEALDYGFPSVMPTPEMKESPIIPAPRPSTRGHNLGLDIHRFMRNEVISWMGSEDRRSMHESVQIDQPESESEKEVESFARELAVQNAVPVVSAEEPRDEHYDRDFDISDYEHVIDDSQDDRGTPSPASPVTPTTIDNIPLPLAMNAMALSRRHHSETVSINSRLPTGLHRQISMRAPQNAASRSINDNSMTRSLDMVRTAPPMPTQTPPQPPPRHASRTMPGSISSVDVSSLSSTSPRTSTNSVRPRSSHRRPVSPLEGQEPVALLTGATTISIPTGTNAVPFRPRANTTGTRTKPSVRDSMTKPLPLRPYENALPTSPDTPKTPAIPQSPRTAAHLKNQHSRVAKKYSYDTPSAYMTPRSPPLAPLDSGPRQMTLRMTLTRPEIRAADEEIYGKTEHGSPVLLHHQARGNKSGDKKAFSIQKSGSVKRMTSTKSRRQSNVNIARMSVADAPAVPTLGVPRAATQEMPLQDTVKREPNKLKKSRTDPVLPDHTPSHPTGPVATLTSAHTPSSLAPLAQLGSDGEWRLISPSMAAAQRSTFPQQVGSSEVSGKGHRKSLWKKMSIAGLRRGGPSVVLP